MSYPASDLDRPEVLLQLLGSFWANSYGNGTALVQDLLSARAQLDAQAHLQFLELLAAMARLTVPVFQREQWFLLTLRDSERGQHNLPRYDATYTYAASAAIQYGVPVSTQPTWPLPPSLAEVPLLLNRLTDSSRTLVLGVDYTVADGVIAFREDPFQDPLIAQRAIFAGNTAVDREAALWVYRGGQDWDTIYRQFGYVLGLRLRSSAGYRELVNAIYDGLTEGTTQRCVEQLLAAIADVPLVKTTGEVVQHLVRDRQYQWVITDQVAYRHALTTTLAVAVGDVLQAGQFLSTAVRVDEFHRGLVPDGLRALAVSRHLLTAGYYQDLVFENKIVPWQITTDSDGYTRLAFEVQGMPTDVAKFWDDVHAAGRAAGQTLAQLLDQRPVKTGEPTALALPATVNPVEFLVSQTLRNNAALVRLRPREFGAQALGLNQLVTLRRLVPPHTLLLFLLELFERESPVTVEEPGDATRPGVTERSSATVGTRGRETVSPSLVSERATARAIQGRCS